MGKNDELLGSGQWHFVNVRQIDDSIARHIMDEKEYSTFFRQLNGDGKFVNVRGTHYFWSNIHSFGPIDFDEDVLSQIKSLAPEAQEFIKKRIMAGVDVSTMEKLRSEIAYFNSK